jgi:hypothetical protein
MDPKRPKDEFLEDQEEWIQEHIYIQEAQIELQDEVKEALKDEKPEGIVQLTKTPQDDPEEENKLPF